MPDRNPFTHVAADIAEWQTAALDLPLPEVQAMTSLWHNSLIESLNDFNASYAHDGGELSGEFEESIVEVVRRATALAIFAVGATQRLHLAAHQN
jgi:hypothetical protein